MTESHGKLNELFTKYIATLIGKEEIVGMNDEEVKFMDVWASQESPFSQSTQDFSNLRIFINKLMTSILSNYEELYKQTGVHDVIQNNTHWLALKDTILTVKTLQINEMKYIGLSITGQILLFFLRATRSAIYKIKLLRLTNSKVVEAKDINFGTKITEADIIRNLNSVCDYVLNVLNEAKSAESKIPIPLAEEVKNLKEQLNTYKDMIEGQRKVDLEKAQQEKINKMILDASKHLANIGNLSKKFIELLNRFDKKLNANASSTELIKTAISNSEVMELVTNVSSRIANVLGSIQHLTNSNPLLSNGFLASFQDIYIKANIISKLPDDNLSVGVTNMAMAEELLRKLRLLYPDQSLYLDFLQLYELLSGSVRVITKVRNLKTVGEGSTTNYKVELGTSTNVTNFKGVEKLFTTFYKDSNSNNVPYDDKTRQISFGPFYKVYDSNTETKTIVNDALDYERLKDMLLNKHGTNVVLYCYGYSGSGKTYTLFGDYENNDTKEGVVWELLRRFFVEEGVTIKLVKRIKLYGVLEPSTDQFQQPQKPLQLTPERPSSARPERPSSARPERPSSARPQRPSTLQPQGDATVQFMLKDRITEMENNDNNSTDINDKIKYYSNQIITDLQAEKLGEKDSKDNVEILTSFTKETSNNDKSSRGFYMLKFEICKKVKGETNKEVKSYLGVVDMAGNEDPYDIAAAMCPTLPFNNMENLIENPTKPSTYDYVYEVVADALQGLTNSVLTSIFFKNRYSYIPDGYKLANMMEYTGDPKVPIMYKALQKNFEFTYKKIQEKLEVQKKPMNDLRLIAEKNMGKMATGKTNLWKTKIDNIELEVTEENIRVVKYSNYITISIGLQYKHVQTILNNKLTLLEEPIKKYLQPNQKFNEYSKTPTLSMIKEVLALSKTNQEYEKILNYILVKYVLNRIETKETEKIKDIIISVDTFKIDNDNVDTIYKDIQRELTKLRIIIDNAMCDLKYLFTVTENTNKVYPYNTIAQIIKEGYYINKANAELIDYFERKRNFEKNFESSSREIKVKTGGKRIRRQKGGTDACDNGCCFKPTLNVPSPTSYPFKGNFDFKSYNKFKMSFMQMNGTTDKKYDTQLVKTLVKEFPNSKDIMFACIRDDKNVGIALGAIDTLLLVQDLKST